MSETNESKDCQHESNWLDWKRKEFICQDCGKSLGPKDVKDVQDVPAKEELKPCPHCGNKPSDDLYGLNYFCFCISCDDPNYIPLEEWNNAYCWKELAKAKELNEALYKSNTDFVNKISALESQLSEHREVAKLSHRYRNDVERLTKQLSANENQIGEMEELINILRTENKQLPLLEEKLLAKEKEIAMLKESMLSQERTHPWNKISALESRVKVLTDVFKKYTPEKIMLMVRILEADGRNPSIAKSLTSLANGLKEALAPSTEAKE